MTREIPVDVIHDVEDVAVDLRAGDGVGVEFESRKHVTAAADANDHDVGVGPDVVGEVPQVDAQQVGPARVSGHVGSRGAVDHQVEKVVGLRVPVDGQTGEGVPALVRVVRVAHSLAPLDTEHRIAARTEVGVDQRETPENQHERGRRKPFRACSRVGGEHECTDRRDRRYENHEARAVEPREEQYEENATDGGADEIRRIQPVHLCGEPRRAARQTTMPL